MFYVFAMVLLGVKIRRNCREIGLVFYVVFRVFARVLLGGW